MKASDKYKGKAVSGQSKAKKGRKKKDLKLKLRKNILMNIFREEEKKEREKKN